MLDLAFSVIPLSPYALAVTRPSVYSSIPGNGADKEPGNLPAQVHLLKQANDTCSSSAAVDLVDSSKLPSAQSLSEVGTQSDIGDHFRLFRRVERAKALANAE
ncbi:hypothetical protein UY3_15820 [Chelonia mydas]|uniref:Uncharacterized protein n=1 Tax=Chelonia mydas TaxID=8469 RepID=M7AVJ8_CHEMY|nr:hypothetical protein UY3_15820 [Chelonia mydas]